MLVSDGRSESSPWPEGLHHAEALALDLGTGWLQAPCGICPCECLRP